MQQPMRLGNMAKLLMILLIGLLHNEPAIALDIISPNPKLQPKNVVEIQLQSLQRNDEPIPDAGIIQTWAFAHPNNRIMTGPIERFMLMIKSQNYKNMLNHRDHKIEPVLQTNDRSQFAVSITTSDDKKMTFKWELMKVQTGEFSGSWMTTSVSAPLLSGNAF
jgi:hypothetical protein|tara:strand:+ start:9448 stop:9936 length:489 start_codon:yes stop_codon:yes gene_type:complete